MCNVLGYCQGVQKKFSKSLNVLVNKLTCNVLGYRQGLLKKFSKSLNFLVNKPFVQRFRISSRGAKEVLKEF